MIDRALQSKQQESKIDLSHVSPEDGRFISDKVRAQLAPIEAKMLEIINDWSTTAHKWQETLDDLKEAERRLNEQHRKLEEVHRKLERTERRLEHLERRARQLPLPWWWLLCWPSFRTLVAISHL